MVDINSVVGLDSLFYRIPATEKEWVLQLQRCYDPKMSILIYNYQELEERTSHRLKTWKAWHVTLFILTAMFGLANYTFLQNAMELVDGNCVLYPRQLAFHWVSDPTVPYKRAQDTDNFRNGAINDTSSTNTHKKRSINETNSSNNITLVNNATDGSEISPRNSTEAPNKVPIIIIAPSVNSSITEERNGTIITVNVTRRMTLDTSRTLFSNSKECQFAEYMPLLSTIMAIVWAVMFIMCPAGGRIRSGLTKPWRIMAPALFFALIFVGLTGHSFVRTNGGLQNFCAAFQNLTSSSTCSSVNPMLERGWNASWGFGGRVAATRAMAAGVWALWACAAALLLARCLAAPDFAVRNTGVYLVKDPQQKVAPHLRRSPRRSQRSAQSTPTKDTSTRSEPTVTTELVSGAVERELDSAPTSLTASPMTMRMQHGEAIELAYSPKLNGNR